jgi:predicted nucleic acid-binding protein
VLQEFFVNITPEDRQAARRGSGEEDRRRLLALVPAHPGADDVLAAIGIHQRAGISFRDAMIVRSAAEIGWSVLYSENL